jgi:hypothetical protein
MVGVFLTTVSSRKISLQTSSCTDDTRRPVTSQRKKSRDIAARRFPRLVLHQEGLVVSKYLYGSRIQTRVIETISKSRRRDWKPAVYFLHPRGSFCSPYSRMMYRE